jgi:uncharacterized protein YecE (DUF72 family)
MSIWIGTAAWADKGLTDCGRFYPPEVTTPAGRLHYYTTQFPLVEVDSSFYAIPAVRTAEQWAERTPEGFVMNAKAFRLFTGHQTSPAALPADVRDALPLELKAKAVLYYREIPLELLDELWQQFGASLAPLREAGRLGLVHFQFPPWLLRNRAGHAHVEQCVERMHGFNLSVEFRNASWFDGFHARETLSFERALKVVHTVVDEPQGFSNSVRPLWEITHSQYALVRMHGRNTDAWNNMSGRSSGRFNYLYDEAELEGLGWSIRDLADEVPNLHVVLNNNNQDQAQNNGLMLMNTVSATGADVVQPGAENMRWQAMDSGAPRGAAMHMSISAGS